MAYGLDLNTVVVNQELAIDSSSSYASYAFCIVTRVTKTQIEVRKTNGDESTIKFSKVTGRPLQVASWDSRNRLVSAEDARAALARESAKRKLQAERNAIKTKITDIATGYWTKAAAAELRALADRMELVVTE